MEADSAQTNRLAKSESTESTGSDYLTSFVMVDEAQSQTRTDEQIMGDFEILSDEDANSSDDDEEVQSKFGGIRPTWQPDSSTTVCVRCELPFSFFRRRHHCRFCGQIFCRDCCHVRASYPTWFGYNEPQRVCELCIPELFDKRQQKKPTDVPSDVATISIVRANSNPKISKHGFETAGEEVLSFPLRFMHPLCRFAFWFSGMYEGGAFNRTFLNTAANMNLPFVGDPVKSIERREVLVPKQWPPYGEKVWDNFSVSELDQTQQMNIPVFIFTPLTTTTAPLPVLVWYHGGGFCLGSAENMVYQTICRSLAHRTHCIVVSVEYRLAPEYKSVHADYS